MERAAQKVAERDLPQVTCRRSALLSLPREAYERWADPVEQGFREAGAFLNEYKIIWHKDVPYPPQLVTMAATFGILGNDAQSAAAKQKLAKWFWCVALGELYGSSTETRIARDVVELVDWLKGSGPRPRSVDEALFQRDGFIRSGPAIQPPIRDCTP